MFSMEPTKRERQAKERLERLQRRERRRMEQMNDCTTIVVSDKSGSREKLDTVTCEVLFLINTKKEKHKRKVQMIILFLKWELIITKKSLSLKNYSSKKSIHYPLLTNLETKKQDGVTSISSLRK